MSVAMSNSLEWHLSPVAESGRNCEFEEHRRCDLRRTLPTPAILLLIIAAGCGSDSEDPVSPPNSSDPCSSPSTICVPSEAPTIQAGIDAASAGDTVLVAPGTYYEHDIQLQPAVTLMSQAGPEGTTIDALYSGSGIIGAEGAAVVGFTIMSSGGLNTAGVYCYEVSILMLNNVLLDHAYAAVKLIYSASEIRGNEIHVDPVTHFAAESVTSWGGSPLIAENVIYDTDPNGNSSAVELNYPSPDEPSDTVVCDNVIYGRVWISGGGVTDPIEVRHNLIVVENGYSSAINMASVGEQTLIVNNTLVGGGLFLQGGSSPTISKNIIAFAREGIESWGGSVSLSCNDLWENEQDYAGIDPGMDDFSEDPLFCLDDNPAGPYSLHANSPCLPQTSPCGELVGAFGAGCNPTTPAEGKPWSAIKAIYR